MWGHNDCRSVSRSQNCRVPPTCPFRNYASTCSTPSSCYNTRITSAHCNHRTNDWNVNNAEQCQKSKPVNLEPTVTKLEPRFYEKRNGLVDSSNSKPSKPAKGNRGANKSPQRRKTSNDKSGKSNNTTPRTDKKAPEDHEYVHFLLKITEDILRNNIYKDADMEKLFESHIKANKGRLDEGRMRSQVEKLKAELKLPLQKRDMCECGEGLDNCKCCQGGSKGEITCCCGNPKCPAHEDIPEEPIREEKENKIFECEPSKCSTQTDLQKIPEITYSQLSCICENDEKSPESDKGKPELQDIEGKTEEKIGDSDVNPEEKKQDEVRQVATTICIEPARCSFHDDIEKSNTTKKDSSHQHSTSAQSMVKIVNKDNPNNTESQLILYNSDTAAHCFCSVSLQKTALKIQLDDTKADEEYILVDGPVCMPRTMLETKTIAVLIQNVSSIILDGEAPSEGGRTPSLSHVNLYPRSEHSDVEEEEELPEIADSVSVQMRKIQRGASCAFNTEDESDAGGEGPQPVTVVATPVKVDPILKKQETPEERRKSKEIEWKISNTSESIEDLPVKSASGIIPTKSGSGVVPAKSGSGVVPTKSGSGVVPAKSGSGVVPTKSGSGVVPTKSGSGVVPTKSGSGVVPTKSGSGVVPAKSGSGVVPTKSVSGASAEKSVSMKSDHRDISNKNLISKEKLPVSEERLPTVEEGKARNSGGCVGPCGKKSPLGKDPSTTLGKDPSGTLRKDPSSTLGKDPSGTLGKDPSGTLRKDPSSTLGKDPSGTLGKDPSGTLRKDPSGTLRKDPSSTLGKNPSGTLRRDRSSGSVKKSSRNFSGIDQTDPTKLMDSTYEKLPSGEDLIFDASEKYHFLLKDVATSTTSCDIANYKTLDVQNYQAADITYYSPPMEVVREFSSDEDLSENTVEKLDGGKNLIAAEYPVLKNEEHKVSKEPELPPEPEQVVSPEPEQVLIPEPVLEIPPSPRRSDLVDNRGVTSQTSSMTGVSADKHDLRIFEYSMLPSRTSSGLGYKPELRYTSGSGTIMSEEVEETTLDENEQPPIIPIPPVPHITRQSSMAKGSDDSSSVQKAKHEGLKVRYSINRELFDQEHQEIINKLDELPKGEPVPLKGRDESLAAITDRMKEFRKIENDDDTNRRFQISDAESFEIRRMSNPTLNNNPGNEKQAQPTCCGLVQPPKSKKKNTNSMNWDSKRNS